MGKTFKFVVFFLFLVIIGLSGALWHQIMRTQEDMDKLHKHVKVLIDTQKSSQSGLNQQVTALTQKITDQQNAMTEINTQVSTLLNHAPGDDRAWKISEIIYLVRMANLQLSIQHDIPNALVLLKQAESRLTALHDGSLDNFHAVILKNIAVLQNAPMIDIDVLTDQLTQLRDQVPALSILVSPKPNTSITEKTPHQEHKKWWHRAWDNVKASLKQLVVITHQDAAMPALMNPDQKLYLQENLQLLIMQAQWALINHDNNLYQKSLNQAKDWVQKYYVQNSATTQGFLKQLDNLTNHNIAIQPIDLTQTLALIREGN